MHVVGDVCSFNHDYNRPVNVYSYDPKDGHRSTKTVDATVGYQDPNSSQKFILMIDQAICINGIVNYLLKWCAYQWSPLLAESPSEITNALELVDSFNATHPLTIPLQSSRVVKYFDMYTTR